MKLRTLLMVAGIVALLYGVGLVLAPAFMATTYGMGTSASEILLARFFGTTLLIVGLITWLSRDFTGASARPIILGSLVGDVIGFIVALMGTLAGTMSSVGWSAVVIYLVLGLGFAYFQFMAPPK